MRRVEAAAQRSVTARSRIVACTIACLVALSLAPPPAEAAGKRSADKDRRPRIERTHNERRDRGAQPGARKTDRHRNKARPAAAAKRQRGKNNRQGNGKNKRKLVALTSLEATVDGISVAPDSEQRVKGTSFHRPPDPSADETQAAGSTSPAPSSRGGMFNFLFAALLLASLAAWLIRQVGPLRD